MRAFLPMLIAAAASWAVPEGIPIQYMDSRHRMPTPASQSPAFSAGGAGCAIEFSTPSTRGMAGRVIVIVEDGLDEEIVPSLTTFFSDLSADGFSPELWILTGGSPAGMRSYLQAEYAEGGLSGAVLVGNVPTGWMETSEGEYPVDLYLAANSIEGLSPGIYRYRPQEHSLDVVREGDFRNQLSLASLSQGVVARASAVLVMAGVFQRSRQKYGERSYRYVLIECGHIAQNVYLAATSMGLGACAVGAFLDDEVNGLLGLDGEEEAALYLVCVGNPQPPV